MARPRTKDQLLLAAASSFEKLTGLWDGFPPKQARALFPEAVLTKGPEPHWRRDACLRDVVIHLHEWHNLVIAWATANLSGTPANFFPEPYTWRNYGELNERFTQRHRDTSYEDARELLAASHATVLEIIDGLSNEELFTKKYFPWTGTTSLGSYFVSATSSHYEWAAKKTRVYKRALG